MNIIILMSWMAIGITILSFLTGRIKPSWVKEAMENRLDPWLTQKELPFDKNLAALGVLEPEFVEVPDLEAWQAKVKEIEAQNSLDYEPILELGSDLPVAYMGQTATPEFIEPPTKLEIRWRNTLAADEIPQPGRPGRPTTMCLLDHKHTVGCAPIPRGESELCW